MSDYSYTRYLASKRTVDDRALNKDVVAALRRALQPVPSLRVLEIGAGLGTMVARLIEWGIVVRADYTLVDVDAQLLIDSRVWLRDWALEKGYQVDQDLRIQGPGLDVTVHFQQAELEEFLDSHPGQTDLLVANAFLDLVEVGAMLPRLFRLIGPNGLYWFSINFDGETIFQPEHEDDAKFMAVYHRSMDERVRYGRPAGESKTGRHLFGHLTRIVAAGGSDWVVFPPYVEDEAYFLRHILHTIETELSQHPELEWAHWMALRQAQIERGELTYVAHQLDFTGHPP